jgi:hypothetical protein
MINQSLKSNHASFVNNNMSIYFVGGSGIVLVLELSAPKAHCAYGHPQSSWWDM